MASAPAHLSRRISRRRFLASAVATAGLITVRRSHAATPRIIVVGGGLAGLTAASTIRARLGIFPDVFEAADRFGGRVLTIRGLSGGQHAEAGGTFISSGDKAVRELVRSLDLRLTDLNYHYPRGHARYFFKNRVRHWSEWADARRATARAAEQHFEKIPWPLTFRNGNRTSERFDHMSVAEWIDTYTPKGLDSLLGRYLRVYFETEYGGAIEASSAIQLIADFAAPGRSYDERYLVAGGNDRIVTRLVRKLPEAKLHTGSPLRRIARNGDGSYSCTFGQDADIQVTADHVVLALPFSALRDVDHADAGFSSRKIAAIEGLGMGNSAKLNIRYTKQVWQPELNGDSLSDLMTGSTWPGHSGQDPPPVSLVCLTGSETTDGLTGEPVHGRATAETTKAFVADLDRLFPGSKDLFIDGEAYIDNWPADEWIKGSYAYYPTGGFTSYAGAEATMAGRVYFCGEHTASYGNSGTMNGAIVSGRKAGEQVVSAIQAR